MMTNLKYLLLGCALLCCAWSHPTEDYTENKHRGLILVKHFEKFQDHISDWLQTSDINLNTNHLYTLMRKEDKTTDLFKKTLQNRYVHEQTIDVYETNLLRYKQCVEDIQDGTFILDSPSCKYVSYFVSPKIPFKKEWYDLNQE